jgi:hypothetical protein
MLIEAKDEGESLDSMREMLQELPNELDELFTKIFSKMDKHKLLGTLRMMQLVQLSQRPITPTELCYAVDFASRKRKHRKISDGTYEQVEDFIRSRSGGLIEVQQSIHYVQFIHESVSEYLTRQNGFGRLDPFLIEGPIGKSHDQLKSLCVEYIDIKDFVADHSAQLFVEYPFLNYAATSLFEHAKKAEYEGLPQDQLVSSFEKPTDHVFQCWKYWYDNSNPKLPHDRWGGYPPGTTLLHLVSEYNIQSCFEALMQSGVDINIRGGHFGSAVKGAAFGKHRKIVQTLLEGGAIVCLYGDEYTNILQVNSLSE